MADTVITTPSAYERSDSSAGWAVAVIILLAVIAFGVFVAPSLLRNRAANNTTPAGINVDVRLPQGQQDNSGTGQQPAPTPAQ